MQAALAITQATKLLIQSANEFEQERITKGRQLQKDPSSIYRRDPSWTEQLILAARAVAEAVTLLVNSATDAAEGKINDAELIQAAKAVAAATANLVAATRVKSDSNSQSQQKLDNAANAVIRATGALVDAARSLANRDKFELINKAENDARAIKEEIEMQAQILRLEKQIDIERQILSNFKRQSPSSPLTVRENNNSNNPFHY